MKTTNNIPVKIDTQTRARIFMQYAGQLVQCHVGITPKFTPFIFEAASLEGWVWDDNKDDKRYIDDCTLLLKPLGEISDEDLKEIRVKFHFDANMDLASVSDIIDAGFLGLDDNWTGIEILHLCDFLRSSGYALPYGPYSVDQLVTAGIYKLTV